MINAQTLQEELATAIGDGVAVAVDRLRGAKAKSKVLVLLTDGDSNAGVVDPREAARIAAESGIRLYTIGIGRSGMVPFPQEDEFGNRVLVPAQFRIDEDLLREMAQAAGGRYFHAADSEGLAQVYAEIDKLEKSAIRGDEVLGIYRNCSAWFAGPGLALILRGWRLVGNPVSFVAVGRRVQQMEWQHPQWLYLILPLGGGLAGAFTLFPPPCGSGRPRRSWPRRCGRGSCRPIRGPDSG